MKNKSQIQSPYQRYCYLFSLANKVIEDRIRKSNTYSFTKKKPIIFFLEIGCWFGNSTVILANVISKYIESNLIDENSKVIAVDHWQDYFNVNTNNTNHYIEMNALSKKGKSFEIFKQNLNSNKINSFVKIFKSKSSDFFKSKKALFFRDKIDLAFVDGSHLYKDVISDLENSYAFCSESGVICGDDLERAEEPSDKDGHITYLIDNDVDFCSRYKYHPGVTRAFQQFTFNTNKFDGKFSYIDGFYALKKRIIKNKCYLENIKFDKFYVPFRHIPIQNKVFLKPKFLNFDKLLFLTSEGLFSFPSHFTDKKLLSYNIKKIKSLKNNDDYFSLSSEIFEVYKMESKSKVSSTDELKQYQLKDDFYDNYMNNYYLQNVNRIKKEIYFLKMKYIIYLLSHCFIIIIRM